MDSAIMVRSIKGCARCDGDGHEDLEFRPFTQSVDIDLALGRGSSRAKFTHWAMCPTLNEPILMAILNNSSEAVTWVITQEDLETAEQPDWRLPT